MNWKLLVKYPSISVLLVVFALCLLLPLQKIDAGSPEPTPGTRMNIITRLQPGWTPNGVTESWNYFPIILKYAGGAPIPTATPSGLPMPGVWSGNTNQDYPVNFTVASSRTSLSQYNIKYRVSCEGGSVTREGSILGDWPITHSNFNISDSLLGHVFEGTFTSTTSAHGTWSASFDSFIGYCSGSGTWTAAR